MGKIREVHSPILLRVSLTQSLVFSATQKEKEQKIPHFQLFEQNYLCIKCFFLFLALVNGVLLQNTGRFYGELSLKETFVFIGQT